jgi:hypothetical protein
METVLKTKTKYFLLWFVPLLFAVFSMLSFKYPGDEYGLWAYSSIAGTWIWFIIPPFSMQSFITPVVTALIGALVITLPALLLVKLRVNIKLWFVIFVICATLVFISSIKSYPTIEKALSKNGSWQAYIFASINIGIYLSILLAAISTIVIKLVKKRKFNKL